MSSSSDKTQVDPTLLLARKLAASQSSVGIILSAIKRLRGDPQTIQKIAEQAAIAQESLARKAMEHEKGVKAQRKAEEWAEFQRDYLPLLESYKLASQPLLKKINGYFSEKKHLDRYEKEKSNSMLKLFRDLKQHDLLDKKTLAFLMQNNTHGNLLTSFMFLNLAQKFSRFVSFDKNLYHVLVSLAEVANELSHDTLYSLFSDVSSSTDKERAKINAMIILNESGNLTVRNLYWILSQNQPEQVARALVTLIAEGKNTDANIILSALEVEKKSLFDQLRACFVEQKLMMEESTFHQVAEALYSCQNDQVFTDLQTLISRFNNPHVKRFMFEGPNFPKFAFSLADLEILMPHKQNLYSIREAISQYPGEVTRTVFESIVRATRIESVPFSPSFLDQKKKYLNDIDEMLDSRVRQKPSAVAAAEPCARTTLFERLLAVADAKNAINMSMSQAPTSDGVETAGSVSRKRTR